MEEYICSNAALQTVTNLCGSRTTGGLGEAKFHINGAPFQGFWGRPQTDGPALRASVCIAHALILLDTNQSIEHLFAPSAVNSDGQPGEIGIIGYDLAYILSQYDKESFELLSLHMSCFDYPTLIRSSMFLLLIVLLYRSSCPGGKKSFVKAFTP